MDVQTAGVTRKLIGLYLPTLAISFGQGLVLPAVPTLTTRFGISPGLAAQIVTAYALGRVLALVPSGMLVDRVGPGVVLMVGSVCLLAGAVTMLLSPFFWGWLVGQALIGAGSSLWIAAREISGLQLVRADQRGRLMSGFFGFQLAGIGLGPVVGGVVLDASGLPALLLVNFAVAVLVGGQTVILSRSGVASPAFPTVAAQGVRGGSRPSARLRDIALENRATFLILAFATFNMHVHRYGFNSLLPLYAGVTRGLSSTQVGTLFGISSLWITLMILPAGFILDRVGRKWAAVPAAAIPAVAFAAIPFARTMGELTVIVSVIGISTGLSLGSLSTFSYDIIPEHARGRLQAMRRLVGEFGALLGPLAGGVLADRSGAGPAFFVYVPLLVITALLLAFGARETLHRKERLPAARTRVDTHR